MATAQAGYTLDNAWQNAHRRLSLIEEIFDEATTTHLTRLGVAPGWRCLELGAGAGSVARWLSDRVGGSGTVTAVDLEPRFLEDDPRPNMEILRHDVVADGIPGEGYDLIHARALLVHLSTRDELLPELLARLRPGGVLLLEEPDLTPYARAESPTCAEAFDLICKAVATKGSDWCWPQMLPRKLVAAGAVDAAASAVTHLSSGGAAMAQFWILTVDQLRPFLLAEGIPPGLLDTFVAELADPYRWFESFALVSAWGYRPI